MGAKVVDPHQVQQCQAVCRAPKSPPATPPANLPPTPEPAARAPRPPPHFPGSPRKSRPRLPRPDQAASAGRAPRGRTSTNGHHRGRAADPGEHNSGPRAEGNNEGAIRETHQALRRCNGTAREAQPASAPLSCSALSRRPPSSRLGRLHQMAVGVSCRHNSTPAQCRITCERPRSSLARRSSTVRRPFRSPA